MNRYCALLRGINVGGNNIIKMVDLKLAFENMGCSEVKTYIQSGNVVFSSDEQSIEKLTNLIEERLSTEFDYKSKIVLITKSFLNKVIEEKPEEIGAEPDKYKYDCLFVKPPLTTKEVFSALAIKVDVDAAWDKNGIIYFSRFGVKSSQSQLVKFVSSPMYKQVTIRNWKTTNKLASLM